MTATKDQRDPPPPSRGDTRTAQGEDQAPKARTPNERDESADGQAAETEEARRMGQIAHDDFEAGKKDTTKGAEMDATYQRVRTGGGGRA